MYLNLDLCSAGSEPAYCAVNVATIKGGQRIPRAPALVKRARRDRGVPLRHADFSLSKILKRFPEIRPALFQAAAHIDVGMIFRFFVLHAKSVPGFRHQFARFEIMIHESPRESCNDHRLRRRIAIPVRPKRISSADRRRQSISRPQQINRASLAIICGEHRCSRALRLRQRIANLRHASAQIPASRFRRGNRHLYLRRSETNSS